MGDEQGTPEEGRPGAAAESAAAASGERTRLTRGMRRVLWAVGAVVAAGLIGAIWLLTTGGGGASPAGDDGANPDTGGTPQPTAAQGPLPGATPTTGSEVQPPDPSASPSDRLPPPPAPTPLVDAPLPPSASASGKLVDGFPTDVMGPARVSDVLQSAIATEGDTMQVTLVARTDAKPDEVREHYRALWSGLGLAGASGADVAYSDALSSITLAFSPGSGTGTLYTVYGVFRTS